MSVEIACSDFVELVDDYLDGGLDEARRDSFELHETGCAGCLAYHGQLRRTRHLLAAQRRRPATGAGPSGEAAPQPAERQAAFKFLQRGAVGPFSGFRWPADEWVSGTEPFAVCAGAIHACGIDDLPYWLHEELWRVELGGPVQEHEHKLLRAVRAARRAVTAWDGERARRFASHAQPKSIESPQASSSRRRRNAQRCATNSSATRTSQRRLRSRRSRRISAAGSRARTPPLRSGRVRSRGWRMSSAFVQLGRLDRVAAACGGKPPSGVVLLVCVIAAVARRLAAPRSRRPPTNEKQVRICHATSSETNPYVSETPAIANNGDLQGGHLNHEGPVFPGAEWGHDRLTTT